MSRTSERVNKGKLPSHLKEFIIEKDADDSDQSDEFDTTILANEMADEEQSIQELIKGLAKQFATMQTQLSKKNEELQTRMDEKNRELQAKLEATTQQLASIQNKMADVSTPSLNSASSFPIGMQSFPSTSSSTLQTTTPTSSSSNSTPTDVPYSVQHEHESTPLMNYNPSLSFRKHLVPLKKFNGNPLDWLVFIADYNRTTAEYKYTSADNTTRLNDCLEGKARELVQWLLIHNDMADKIVERLEKRFGQPEFLVDAQISMLKEIPKISDSKIEQIVDFADKVINFSHFMLSSKSEHHLSNPTLLKELVLKLPMNIRINWASHLSSIQGVANILDFSRWIEGVADNIARVPMSSSVSNLQIEKKPAAKKGQVLHASNSNEVKQVVCVLCSKEHSIANCPEFLKKPIDDKWNVVREKKLCFSCLRTGHQTRTCRSRKSCNKNGCKRIHHSQLHTDSEKNDDTSRTESALLTSNSVINFHAATNEREAKVLFKVVPVKLYNGSKTFSTFAMIDEGSSVSLINKDLAERMGVSGPSRRLNLQWFGDKQSTEDSQMIKVQISGVHSKAEIFEMVNVCTVKDLKLPIQSLNINKLHTKFGYLRNLPIMSYENVRPELLIGLDYCYLGLSSRKIHHVSNGPIVAESPLGWIVYGRQNDNKIDSNPVRMFHASECLDNINSMVKEYFTTENFGVQQPSTPLESSENCRARDILEKTTKRVGERYESGLLWRIDDVMLPDSYQMALNRFRSIENKMSKDSVYASKYKQTIANYIEKGYARELTPKELQHESSRTWYLPHFGVLNPNKPDKFRLVFDAAAVVDGVSLNSSLMSGPDLNQPLLTVLSKFREGRIGVCADIREMFHQVLIRQQDQDSQRFIWRNEKTGNIEIYKMLVMTFGSTSSPTTAQYVKNFHANLHANDNPKAVEAIVERHYVDDYVNCFQTDDEAISVTLAVKEILRTGGFILRGFISNSKVVAVTLNPEENSQPQVDMNFEKSTSCDKILGMVWDTSTDEFRFQLKFHRIEASVLECTRIPTKREFLAIVMSVYDPFGFLADFLIYMKVLLQLVWRSGIEWDQPLPKHLHERWCAWNKELKKVADFRILRCISDELWSSKSLEFHIFVDSSEVAFSAVVYLRSVTSENSASVSFIIGKTKCAPVKFLSVPRLELQAAILGVRLFNTVKKSQSFCVSKATFWSDSKTVLHWIKDDKRKYKTFVANRVSEILDSTTASQWNWVSTQHNPADEATRDKFPPIFNPRRRWIDGPDWLREDKGYLPNQPEFQEMDVSRLELKPVKHNVQLTADNQCFQIDFSRYSSYFKFLRTFAWIIRYISNLKAKISGVPVKSGELTVHEVSSAESFICRVVQMEVYREEYRSILRGEPVDKKSELYQLTPMIDENGVIRLNGRVDNAPSIPLMTKRPIILPRNHRLTILIVNQYHLLNHHQNEETTICSVRTKFWINNLRVLVRATKRNCQQCKNEAAEPERPQMGQLPLDRLIPYVRPFTYCGLDYFGPVFVTVGRRREKRWVALFTCLTIRAVHLEIAENLSTDACIICLRNFINLRGVPARIRSDNGSNFIGVKGELATVEDIYNKDAIITESTMKGIEWLFNCPSNPSEGGCWERLVRSIKTVLKKSLKEVAPRVETLRSCLIEAANIVNSRPLTHVPVASIEDEPLTPNSFLLGVPNGIQGPGPEDEKLWTFRKQWRIAGALKNHFWRRWVREFLPTLTRRTKDFARKDPIKVGDVGSRLR